MNSGLTVKLVRMFSNFAFQKFAEQWDLAQKQREKEKKHLDTNPGSVTMGYPFQLECTHVFEQQFGIPCCHTIYTRISSNTAFKVTDFDPHWVLKNNHVSTAFFPPQNVLLITYPIHNRPSPMPKRPPSKKETRIGSSVVRNTRMGRNLSVILLGQKHQMESHPQGVCAHMMSPLGAADVDRDVDVAQLDQQWLHYPGA